jgi:predicted transporter
MLCRSSVRSIASTGILGNSLILWGIVWEVGLLALIAYTPWGNAFFGTAPLSIETWAALLPWAAGMLALEELRKYLVRRYHRFGAAAAAGATAQNS